jgi:hypothetical protein
MYIPEILHSAVRTFASFAVMIGLSGCWMGPNGLLDSEPSVAIESLFENGRHAFVSESDDRQIAIIEVLPDGARYAYGVGDEAWRPISDVKAISVTVEGSTEILHVVVGSMGGRSEYIPFFVTDGYLVFVVAEKHVEDADELLADIHAAVTDPQDVSWVRYRAIPPEDAEVLISRLEDAAQERAEQRQAERERQAAENAERGRRERERQEREREERERLQAAEFRSDGYAVPRLFEAIYSGDTRGWRSADHALYLHSFALIFYNAGDDRSCNAVISPPAVAALSISATGNTLGMLFGPLVEAHRQGSAGRDQAFGDGARAGAQGTMSLVQAESLGQRDARLFYSRHTCVSPTAVRFFANFNRYVIQQ